MDPGSSPELSKLSTVDSLTTVLDGSSNCSHPALSLIIEMSSQFEAAKCGYAYNYQLATDVLANNINNQSFIFDCTNTYSSSLPIEPCIYSLTFCIGGHNQQHACTLGECTVIDWSNAHAGACAGHLTNYTNTWLTTGLAPVCCDSAIASCVSPTPNSYNCSGTGADLWLCIVKAGVSAECVKPLDSSICSSNFTSDAFPASSSTTSTAGTSATSASSSSTGGISGSSMILIIIFSTLVGLSVIAGMSARYRRHLQQQQLQAETRDGAEGQSVNYNGPDVPNGSRTDNVMVNRSNLTDVGRDHNTYHIHGENARIALMN